MTDLIKVTQLPIIEERLLAAKQFVDQTVADAVALICTEETVVTVKEKRAELNKMFSELEEQRKSVKREVQAPYERFEAIYRSCVADSFKWADATLKQKISDVEGEMKRRCEEALRAYYSELCEAHHIDFVPYERAGITISMTDAKAKTQPPKKLKEQLIQFITGVSQSVEMISDMDNAAEIMVEFKQSLDAPRSIALVQARHRAIEEEKATKEKIEAAKSREAEAVKKVEAFAPPVEKEPAVRCSFTVTATKSQLKRLKEFMNMEGIKYE